MCDGELSLCGGRYLLTYTGNQGEQLASFSLKRTAAAQYQIGKGRVVDIATLFAYGYALSNEKNNLTWIRKVVGEPDSKFAYLPTGVRADEVFSNGKGFIVVDNTTCEEVTFTVPYEICEIVGNCYLNGKQIVIEKNKTAIIKVKA